MTHEYILTRDILRSNPPTRPRNLSKVTRPFPRWEGSGNETSTKEGLWHSSSIWDGPIRLQDFACHAIVTFKLTCDSYPNPAPWARHNAQFAITRSLLKCACACALCIVSCPGGGVWVAVTREFERDNCMTSEILQSDWTIPNRERPSFVLPRPLPPGKGSGDFR